MSTSAHPPAPTTTPISVTEPGSVRDPAPTPPGPRGSVVALVRRAPLASFLVLSLALSWWPAALYAAGWYPAPNAGFGPFLAAVTVLGLTQGRSGIGRLLRSMVQWRVPARGYLAALGLPVLVSGSAVLANLALGAARPAAGDLATWTSIPLTLAAVLLIPVFGGAWEEPGFRGYALGRLETRYGVVAGPLLLGTFWVLWHLPLFITGDILWPDVLVIMAASVVIAQVFHSARDSVLIAMLLHATNNAVAGNYASPLFHGHDSARLGLLTAAGWWLIAGAILIHNTHRRRNRQQAPTAGSRP
jgi:uncharacterized protein